MSDFGKVAGTELNAGKCEGMWLGNVDTRHMRNDLFGIKWKSSMRCVGIYFGKDHRTNYKKNWSEKLESIESCLMKWEKRDLINIIWKGSGFEDSGTAKDNTVCNYITCSSRCYF